MPLRNVRFVLPAVVLTGALALSGCAGSSPEQGSAPSTGAPAVAVNDLSTHTVLLDSADPVELALTTSQTVYARSEVVVLADADDEAARPALAATAEAVHAPALLADADTSGSGLTEEMERLGARAAVVVTGDEVDEASDGEGDAAPGEASRRAADAAGVQAVEVSPDLVEGEHGAEGMLEDDDLEDLSARLDALLGDGPTASASADGSGETGRDEPQLLREVLALVDPEDGQEAAIASLRAAGAVTTEVPGGDLGTRRAVQTVDRAQALTVVGVGRSFGDPATFAWRVAAAERAALLPTRSQHLLPARYVTVDASVWDDPATAVARAQAAAAAYAPADDGADGGTDDGAAGPVVPTLVLPASATESGPGEDGDWVTRQDVDALRPLVAAARDAGVYVLLDVGAGPGPVVDQVRAAEPLLRNPGVGVALHPESRVGDGVTTTSHEMAAAEVDGVTAYLADLASREGLPPSLLVVHQTRPESVADRARLRSVPQVETVLVADRTGGVTTGEWVWNQVSADAPEGLHLGWSGPPSGVASSLVPTDPAPVVIATS
ncbi:hypothetical protein ACQFYA_16885 [Promicromonospora sp. Marseille-Q5078]